MSWPCQTSRKVSKSWLCTINTSLQRSSDMLSRTLLYSLSQSFCRLLLLTHPVRLSFHPCAETTIAQITLSFHTAKINAQIRSDQSLSCVWLFATPWIAAHQSSLSNTNSRSSLRRPSSQWCHPTISSSVVPFFSCPQSLPASESFPMSQLFAWGAQSSFNSGTPIIWMLVS